MESVSNINPKTLDKYRYINVEHFDWWDSTYEMFKETMEAIGIGVEQMYFSGFWSQGDGACFNGKVEDWDLFLKSVGYENNPTLIQHAMDSWSFKVEHSGRYYHENCTHFTGDLPMPDGYGDEEFIRYFSTQKDEIRSNAWLALLTNSVHKNFEELFADTFKNHMRELYELLEEEYDYQVSDEAVTETVLANDLDDEDEGE